MIFAEPALLPEQFAATPQIGIFYRPKTRGLVDDVLGGSRMGRRLQVTSPHFLTVPYLIAESDLAACVPEGLARRFHRIFPLRIWKLPFSTPRSYLRLARHERNDDDPAQPWFHGLICEERSLCHHLIGVIVLKRSYPQTREQAQLSVNTES